MLRIVVSKFRGYRQRCEAGSHGGGSLKLSENAFQLNLATSALGDVAQRGRAVGC